MLEQRLGTMEPGAAPADLPADSADSPAASFRRLGYAIVPGVLTPDEVDELRAVCTARLAGHQDGELPVRDFLADPVISGPTLRPRVIAALRDIYGGPFVLYPNMTVRRSVYVPWHVDAAFAGLGKQYVWDERFRHVQCAIYLQDNDPELGGGIDVIDHSHAFPTDGGGFGLPQHDLVVREAGAAGLVRRLPSRAGDLVLWHARLMHASSGYESAPREKYGIFFSTGRGDLHDDNRYLSHLASKRVRRSSAGDSELVTRHDQLVDFRADRDVPDWYRDAAAAAGVRVVSF